MRGEAPWQIHFRWTYVPPIPIGLTTEARAALIKQRLEDYFGPPDLEEWEPPPTKEELELARLSRPTWDVDPDRAKR
jgi:hypothetical protein